MALFAIGDPHLSLGSNKPMDVFGGAWSGYVDKLSAGFQAVGNDDTVVLCGDISWGMSLEEARRDFAFLDALPGKRKLLLKGNHDYWWTTAAKMNRFFAENGLNKEEFLKNANSFSTKVKNDRAFKTWQAYEIDGTPANAVNGKYITAPHMVGTREGAIQVMNYLIEKERAAKK